MHAHQHGTRHPPQRPSDSASLQHISADSPVELCVDAPPPPTPPITGFASFASLLVMKAKWRREDSLTLQTEGRRERRPLRHGMHFKAI